ncbi:MAG: type II toxin-antitoxin system HicB family antitoxin [Fimbriimonadaceae bacterium]|nr:type II toxin-antitoxin system HicB family antitoxin [Fimbriimonadaceae bacterium]
MQRKITIVTEPAEEGGFTAWILEVPGAISEGETIEEAREMVLDALKELSLARHGSQKDKPERPTGTPPPQD